MIFKKNAPRVRHVRHARAADFYVIELCSNVSNFENRKKLQITPPYRTMHAHEQTVYSILYGGKS